MTTRPKFTKTFLLRLLAVGLFLSLGTFAVMHSLKSNDKTEDSQTAENVDENVVSENESTPSDNAEIVISPASLIGDSVTGTTPETTATSFQDSVPPANPTQPFATTGGSFQFGDKPLVQDKPTDTKLSNTSDANPSNSLSSAARALLEPVRGGESGDKSNTVALPGPGSSLIPPLVNNNYSTNKESPFPGLPPVRPGSQEKENSLAVNPAISGFSPAATSQPPLRRDEKANDPSDTLSADGQEAPLTNQLSDDTPTANSNRLLGDMRPNQAFGSRRDFGSPPSAGENSSTFAAQPVSTPPVNPRQQESGAQPGNLQNGSAVPTPPFGQKPPPIAGNGPITAGNQNPMLPINGNRTPATLAAAPIRSTPMNTDSVSMAQPVPGESRFEGVQIPALAVQKVVPREVQVNREATFELIVKNTGRSAADNVWVHDYVPDGARFVTAVPGPAQNIDGRISWDLGTLAPGQQVSIQMKILPERPGDIGSVAHVTFGTQASAKTVCTQPQLAIRHESPDSVLIGQEFVLNIFVENKGNGAADDVVLQEDVPDGLEFSGGQKELEYTIGTLQPGETRNIPLRLRATQVGQVRNVLVAHGAGKLQVDDVVNLRIIAPQLNLQADGPSRKFLNRPATHTFSVANQGTAPATNMQLVARLPRGLKFASANNQGQYDPNNHLVVWRLSKLDPQKTGAVELTTIPVSIGNLDIQVQAIADLNQNQQITRTLAVEQLSELFFDIDDSADAIEVGTGTTYRVRVVNQGQIPSTNVNVQVDFADGIRPESVEGSVRNQIRGQAVVLEPIASLAPGQEVSFIVRANAIAAGEHRTVVSVKSDDRDIAISKEESTHVYSDR